MCKGLSCLNQVRVIRVCGLFLQCGVNKEYGVMLCIRGRMAFLKLLISLSSYKIVYICTHEDCSNSCSVSRLIRFVWKFEECIGSLFPSR